jgi:hypothetical protein
VPVVIDFGQLVKPRINLSLTDFFGFEALYCVDYKIDPCLRIKTHSTLFVSKGFEQGCDHSFLFFFLLFIFIAHVKEEKGIILKIGKEFV